MQLSISAAAYTVTYDSAPREGHGKKASQSLLLVCMSERKCRFKYPQAIGELGVVTSEPS